MTIIAGFKSSNGIVVCADTQETSGPSKRDVPKLRFEARGLLTDQPLAVAFCGSGYGPLIDKLVDECWKAVEPLASMDDVCAEIERTIKRLYEEYGRIFQAGACPSAELIYGVKTRDGSKLFSASDAIVNERPTYHSSGAGYYLADFLASRMYRDQLNLHQCVILAAYILFQAKEHVEGCGGDSHIAILRDDGLSGRVDSTRINAMTDLLRSVDSAFGEISFSVANLDMTQTEIDDGIESLKSVAKHLRDIWRDEIKNQDQRIDHIVQLLGSSSESMPRDSFGFPELPEQKAAGGS